MSGTCWCSYSAAEERTAGREREVASLQCQLSASEANAKQEGQVRAALEEELNRVKSDLGMMTQENQSLHQELVRAGQEQEALAVRARQYTQSIQRFEEAVAAKVGGALQWAEGAKGGGCGTVLAHRKMRSVACWPPCKH